MKKLIVITLALVCALCAFGQTTNDSEAPADTNIAAGGLSWNPGASPQLAGTGLYARLVTGTRTWAFSVIDALPATLKPFVVTTQVSGGVAERIVTVHKIPIFIPVSAGPSYSGAGNVGWAWTAGALAVVPVRGGRLLPNVRVVKSSINDRSGYQVIAGVLYGWGWN